MLEDQKKDRDVLYTKWLRLYENIASDRLAINEKIAEDGKAIREQIKTLWDVINELRAEKLVAVDFKKQIQTDIVEKMDGVTKALSVEMAEEVRKNVTDKFSNSMDNFTKAINKGERILDVYNNYTFKHLLWYLVMLSVLGTLCIWCACKFVLPAPVLLFDEKQAYVYKLGEKMDAVWYKLSEAEEKRINELYREEKKKKK